MRGRGHSSWFCFSSRLNRFDPFVQEAFLNVVAAGIIWLIFAFVRRRILRLLLGYHGWMFER